MFHMKCITFPKFLPQYHPLNKSKVRNLIKLAAFTKHYRKEIKSVWKQSMIKHNYEGNTSFSHTNVSSDFVHTRGNALLPHGCHCHHDLLLLFSLTHFSKCHTGNSSWDLGSQPSSVTWGQGDWSHTHTGLPLSCKGKSPAGCRALTTC